MFSDILSLVLLLLLVAAGGYIIYQQRNSASDSDSESAKAESDSVTESKRERLLLEAEQKAKEIRTQAEKDAQEITSKAKKLESQLEQRERKQLELSNSISSRLEEIEKKERSIEQAKKDVRTRSRKLDSELEKIAQLTREEAEQKLKESVEADLKNFISRKVHDAEADIKTNVETKSRELLVDAMQRSATDFVAETTSTTFQIPDEDLKGKIIGREGRNIKTFERLTGVDIIMDEAPDLITVSSFDPIRREVAALAIQKLIKDGRVHPGSIEETVRNIKNDLSREIAKTGDKLAYDAGFPELPDEIKKLLGRFKYRFSYGQNLAKHSLEMVNLAQQLAQEIGADVQLAKKAALLHDLGKVLTYEIEGKPHHHISGDIVRKYLKDEKLANAVEAHHGDIEAKSIEAVLIMIADSISGARPGARRDNYDDYVSRIKALEDIAKQYSAVKEAYAIKAGREVRVIVNPKESSDEDTKTLAYKIAKEIEDRQNYPGTVKVTVIRETRIEAEAK